MLNRDLEVILIVKLCTMQEYWKNVLIMKQQVFISVQGKGKASNVVHLSQNLK